LAVTARPIFTDVIWINATSSERNVPFWATHATTKVTRGEPS